MKMLPVNLIPERMKEREREKIRIKGKWCQSSIVVKVNAFNKLVFTHSLFVMSVWNQCLIMFL